jgi:CspA family cold shock protein
MMSGTVKFYNADRGFGFISRDDGAGDVFVHATALPAGVDHLRDGQRVSFLIETNPRNGKLQAAEVQPSPVGRAAVA